MKNGIKQIVGKTVSDVVACTNDRSPHTQLFLVFTDGTYLEIYGDHFTCAGGVDQGDTEAVARYTKALGAKITQIYPSAT